MTAARLDLNTDNELAIEQGSDYGPVIFRLRDQERDQWQVTINDAGTDGDVFSVEVFGNDSDRSELKSTGSYTKQAGDQPADVAAGLIADLAALTVTLQDDDTGEDYTEPLSDHLILIDDGSGVFTIRGKTKAVFLDVSVDGTVPANISISHTVDIVVDLTDATITAEVRRTQSSSTVLATWTSGVGGVIEIMTPPTAGRFKLEIPAATTTGYTFESAWWQCEIDRPPSEVKRWFEGCVESRVSLLLQ